MPSKSIGHSDLILHVEFNSPDEKEFTVPEPWAGRQWVTLLMVLYTVSHYAVQLSRNLI